MIEDQIAGAMPAPKQTIPVNPTRRVTIRLAAAVTGLTEKAIEQKIDNGIWREGREWHKGPDGKRYVDLDGYNAWVVSKGRNAA